mgnify:CR=1 FL=1
MNRQYFAARQFARCPQASSRYVVYKFNSLGELKISQVLGTKVGQLFYRGMPPDAGYRFVRWTGDVDTIADVNASSTTITMNGIANRVSVLQGQSWQPPCHQTSLWHRNWQSYLGL